jgi:murein DD-endopeptidase / murein LD-carboxypeptidase
MMSDAVIRARALVGCRFRPQGRDPELGLDCVGLACSVFRIPAAEVPCDYRLRGREQKRLRREIDRHFDIIPVIDAAAGDLLVCSVAPDQLHLAILTDRGFVHADARLRKVVETPGPAPWRILSVHRRRAQSKA